MIPLPPTTGCCVNAQPLESLWYAVQLSRSILVALSMQTYLVPMRPEPGVLMSEVFRISGQAKAMTRIAHNQFFSNGGKTYGWTHTMGSARTLEPLEGS